MNMNENDNQIVSGNMAAYVDRLFDKANSCALAGHRQLAIDLYQEVIALCSDYPNVYYILGLAYLERNELNAAIDAFKCALHQVPDSLDVLNNLGSALANSGQIKEAINYFRRALSLMPESANIHNRLALAYAYLNQGQEAYQHYFKALELDPDSSAVHCNLGNLLLMHGELTKAAYHFTKSLDIGDDKVGSLHNLARILSYRGNNAEALQCFEMALEIKPDYRLAINNLLLTLNYMPEFSAEDVVAYHNRLAPFENNDSGIGPIQRVQGGKRRIGYLSPDFRTHSVCYFLEPVLQHHNREIFEIYCYSNTLVPDSTTERLKSYGYNWRDIVGLSDQQVSTMIQNDKIDILVDLAGHTAGNRLAVFAQKPARIQASWIGYPNTTGLPQMNYFIADDLTLPVGGVAELFQEKIIRLPAIFSCYSPPPEAPPVSSSPAMTNGYVTFGCFNNNAKISMDIVKCWSRILLECPESHLYLKNHALTDVESWTRYMDIFKDFGIEPYRITLRGYTSDKTSHLAEYAHIDIALDTFPYNGTTTTCEALWMGVPTITLAGVNHASRVGLSFMTNVGLPEYVARNYSDYIDIALKCAATPHLLEELRYGLRERTKASPLMNAQRFTLDLEQAYLLMDPEVKKISLIKKNH